jgi:TP901 family phage tail tape measure protein
VALNAIMAIQVRIAARQAQAQVARLETQIASLQARTRAGNAAAAASFGSVTNRLTKMGSQVQWAGRQLIYNFTIPIAAAAAASTKFALDNEKAFVRVRKVYGDVGMSQRQVRNETNALRKSFVALSDTYGVVQKDVINIAADWAAAGSSGVALAKSTELTLKTMILGELGATEATRALIAIQAQYGESTKQLGRTIDTLNMVENQTGTSMADLIQVMSKTAGTARSAGVDVRHLAAFTAAIVPAAGSAASAGNGLKTILSRLMSPTRQASDLLKMVGINTRSASWEAMNGVDRIELLARKYKDLTGAQKGQLATVVAGRYQLNRFDVLMRDVINTSGYYKKALDSTKDSTKNLRQEQRELNQVLDSNPQKFKQLWVIIQNGMAQVIGPLIPLILALFAALQKAVTWFTNLNPALQKWILYGLAALAIFGPLLRMFGALGVLLGYLGKLFVVFGKVGRVGLLLFAAPFKWLWTALSGLAEVTAGALGAVALGIGKFVKFLFVAFMDIPVALARIGPMLAGVMKGFLAIMTGPIGWIITGIVLLFVALRGKLKQIWDNITDAFSNLMDGTAGKFDGLVRVFSLGVNWIKKIFYSLPQAVQNAFMAVIRIVATAARGVYRLFSYLNPFAHHSPSLVESTSRGMSKVRDQHAQTAKDATRHSSTVQQQHQSMANSARQVSAQPLVRDVGSQATGSQATGGAGQVSSLDSIIKKSTADLAAFKNAARGMIPNEWADQIKDVAKQMPSLLGQFKNLIGEYNQLNTVAERQKAAVDAQQKVVDAWQSKLDDANAALDVQQKHLDNLQSKLDKTQAAYDKASDTMQNFAQAPIKGMQVFSDKIFANDLAQKKLQLRMLQWEKNNGNLDDLNNKLQKINGSIAALQGEASRLRGLGAGSDVLGPIQDQIDALQKSATATQNTINNSPVNQLQNQMDKLNQAGQILQLQNDIKFDPLEHQIQKLANTTKELSYDQIINGITRAKNRMHDLQPVLDRQTNAVNNQQKVVDALTKKRDTIQASYDRENRKLQKLNDTYQKTADVLSNIKDALDSVSSAAQNLASKKRGGLSDVQKDFLAGRKGAFRNVGGTARLGREGKKGDQSKQIDVFTKQLQEDLAAKLGRFDMFKPIRQAWNRLVAWFHENVSPVIDGIRIMARNAGKAFGNLFSGSGGGITKVIGSVSDAIHRMQPFITRVLTTIHNLFADIKDVFDLIWPDLKQFLNLLKNSMINAWKRLSPEIEKFKTLLEPLGATLHTLYKSYFLPLAKIVGVILVFAFKILASVIANTIKPVMDTVIEVIARILGVVRNLLRFIMDIFLGRWHDALWAAHDIVFDVFWGIIDIFKGFGKIVWGIIWGFLKGIFGAFEWLWDKLVGHSLIPDMINAIILWFVKLPIKILAALANLGILLLQKGKDLLLGLWHGISNVWDTVSKWLRNLSKHVLEKIGNVTRSLVGKGKDFLNGLWNGVKTIWGNVGDWFKHLGRSILDKIGDVTSTLAQKGKNLLHGLLGGITDKFADVAGWFRDLPGRLAGFFAKAGGWLTGAGGSIAGGLKDGIKAGLNTLKKVLGTPIYWAVKYAIDPIINGLNHLPGVNLPTIDTDSIPHFARGGIVPGKHNRDNVPIYATPGEVVVPKNIVAALGGPRALMQALGIGGGPGGPGAHFGLGGWIVGGVKAVGKGIAGAASALAGVAKGAWKGIRNAGKAIYAAGKSGVHGLGSAIKTSFSEFKKDVIDPATGLLRKGAAKAFMAAIGNPIKSADNFLDKYGVIGHAINTTLDKGIDGLYNWISDGEKRSQDAASKVVNKGGLIGNHKAFLDNALKLTHHLPSTDLEEALGIIIKYESGWNPNAINLTDINAQQGHPSQGLMQTIPSTFEAYRLKSLPDVITNPLANAVAGIRYADSRYGSLNNVPGVVAVRNGRPYVGYDAGGIIPPGLTAVLNNSGRNEVIAPHQTFNDVFDASTGRALKIISNNVRQIVRREMRQSAIGTGANITIDSNNTKTVHVHIDKVEFPNVHGADDVDEFLAKLEAIGDGAV